MEMDVEHDYQDLFSADVWKEHDDDEELFDADAWQEYDEDEDLFSADVWQEHDDDEDLFSADAWKEHVGDEDLLSAHDWKEHDDDIFSTDDWKEHDDNEDYILITHACEEHEDNEDSWQEHDDDEDIFNPDAWKQYDDNEDLFRDDAWQEYDDDEDLFRADDWKEHDDDEDIFNSDAWKEYDDNENLFSADAWQEYDDDLFSADAWRGHLYNKGIYTEREVMDYHCKKDHFDHGYEEEKSSKKHFIAKESKIPQLENKFRDIRLDQSISDVSEGTKNIAIPSQVLNDPIRHLELLGRGSYGNVYAYTDKVTNQTVALKEILSSDRFKNEIDDIRKEVNIHKKLSHANIVQYIGSCDSSHNYLFIIMEFMEGGSLHEKLGKINCSTTPPNTTLLPEEVILRYTANIVNGLVYLHQNMIIHRDLRASNILISSSDVAKIADFGLSKQLLSLSQSGFSTTVGNVFWYSPELIMEDEERKIGRRVDVWSLGITILEMIYFIPPFMKKYNKIQYMSIHRYNKGKKQIPEIPCFVGNEIEILLKKCLVFDSRARSHAHDLLFGV